MICRISATPCWRRRISVSNNDRGIRWNSICRKNFSRRRTFSGQLSGQPPTAKFETSIYHPNIDKNGTICLPILGSGCRPTFITVRFYVELTSLFHSSSAINRFVACALSPGDPLVCLTVPVLLSNSHFVGFWDCVHLQDQSRSVRQTCSTIHSWPRHVIVVLYLFHKHGFSINISAFNWKLSWGITPNLRYNSLHQLNGI